VNQRENLRLTSPQVPSFQKTLLLMLPMFNQLLVLAMMISEKMTKRETLLL
jgi:hypothetical protein